MGIKFWGILSGAILWLAILTGPASAADFSISFDDAEIVTGSVSYTQTPGVNHHNDVPVEPEDVVTLNGTVSDEGAVTVPANGVTFKPETRTIMPFRSYYTIEWRSPDGFTGTFDQATGELNLTGTLEQTVKQLSNSCTTGPIPVSLSTEGSVVHVSGSRFTDGLNGDGALVGKWLASPAKPSGSDCVPSVMDCRAKSDLAGSWGNIALSTKPGRSFGVPSITRCEMRTSLALNKIVYSHDGRIVIENPGGYMREELTHAGDFPDHMDGEGDDQPSLSPDEGMVVFVRGADFYDPGGSSVAIVDRDNREIFTLDESDDYEVRFRDPEFDLDGTHVFYVRTGEHSAVLERETNGLDPHEASGGIPRLRDLEISDIDLSPDGTRLLVGMEGSSSRDGHPISRIYSVSLANGKATFLQADASHGAWSPDGKSIIFESKRDKIGAGCVRDYCSAETRLYVMNANGKDVRRVFPKRGHRNERLPDFSPDGKRITFTSDRSGVLQVYIAKPNGTCLGMLTNGNMDSYSATWGHRFESEIVPPACGNRKLKPRIDLKKSPSEPVHGLPRLWLGSIFRGSSIYSPGDFNGHNSLYYGACVRFAGDCGIPVNVATDDVCDAYPRRYSPYATAFFQSAVRYRGAVVEFYGARNVKGATYAMVLTGGRAVRIEFYSPSPYGTTRPVKWYYPVIDRLRPLWESDEPTGNLPRAAMGTDALAHYRSLLRFSRNHTVAETAKRFGQNKRSIHYSLKAAKRYMKLKVKGIECGES